MSRKNRIEFESADLPNAAVVLLEVKDLNVTFPSEGGRVHAVRGVDFALNRGEILVWWANQVQENPSLPCPLSGLLDKSASVEGSVKLYGTELVGRSDAYMSHIRGGQIGMVFPGIRFPLSPPCIPSGIRSSRR